MPLLPSWRVYTKMLLLPVLSEWVTATTVLLLLVTTCWLVYRTCVSGRRRASEREKVGKEKEGERERVLPVLPQPLGVRGAAHREEDESIPNSNQPAQLSLRVFYATQTGTAKASSDTSS